MKNIMHYTFNRIAGHQKSMLAILGLIVFSLLTIALAAWKAQADDNNANPSSLVGTWRVEIPDFGATSVSYETFTRDGGSVEVNRPGTFNTSIGTWTRVGQREFLATLYKQQFKILQNGDE